MAAGYGRRVPADHVYDPPLKVQVWDDSGAWVQGTLLRRLWDDTTGEWRWQARWTVAAGETYLRTLPAARIREPLEE